MKYLAKYAIYESINSDVKALNKCIEDYGFKKIITVKYNNDNIIVDLGKNFSDLCKFLIEDFNTNFRFLNVIKNSTSKVDINYDGIDDIFEYGINYDKILIAFLVNEFFLIPTLYIKTASKEDVLNFWHNLPSIIISPFLSYLKQFNEVQALNAKWNLDECFYVAETSYANWTSAGSHFMSELPVFFIANKDNTSTKTVNKSNNQYYGYCVCPEGYIKLVQKTMKMNSAIFTTVQPIKVDSKAEFLMAKFRFLTNSPNVDIARCYDILKSYVNKPNQFSDFDKMDDMGFND